MNSKRKINKKAAAAIMALMLTLGTAAAPLSDTDFSIVPMNVVTADAAQTTSYDLNSTSTYKALTKAKVQALYRSAMTEVGTYNEHDTLSIYKPGKAASQQGSWYEGELNPDMLKSFENTVNLYRSLAGLYNVTAESGSLYQKGALVRSTPATFAHTLTSAYSKPAGMSSALWNTGKSCPNWILFYGCPPMYLANGWISERNNLAGETNTGHRMTILNSAYSSIKLGYACGYALGYAEKGTSRMKEAAATFPSAGYMPSEMVDGSAPAPWMIQLNSSKLKVTNLNNVRVTITSGGKTYTRTKANGGLRLGDSPSFYGAEYLEFTKPDSGTKGKYSGSYTVSVTGLTDASGKAATLKYTINFFDAAEKESWSSVSDADVTVSAGTVCYDGKAKTPAVTVRKNGTKLTLNKDYTVRYENNTNAGTAKVIVTGKGKYLGSVTKTFTIKKDTRKEISKCTVTLSQSSFYYTGKDCIPTVTVKNGSTVLKQGTDYTVKYTNTKNVGGATATVTGIGNYKGTVAKLYSIVKDTRTDLSKCSVSLASSVAEYDGTAKTPAVTVKNGTKVLKNGTDYTVTYSANKAVGTAKVTVTGKGSYKGTVTKTFRIAIRVKAEKVTVSAGVDRYVNYTGKAINHKMPLVFDGKLLTEGVDYEYTKWENNTKAGTAKAYVKFIGKYTGSIIRSFYITDKTIVRASECKVTRKSSYAYTGKAVTPEFILKYSGKTLTAGKDYTVTYENNVKRGTATVHFTLKGNYVGFLKSSFTIA